ncbi:hypothetical protein C8R45DRAFT_923392 [Mycena sanguinolenta]|nr:hypothetical protein C8R45DRAFT_923392 [Mycena sanguinolenta]
MPVILPDIQCTQLKPGRSRIASHQRRARAEARKQQRKEYYARNAERLREKSRAKMAEKRMAIKANHRKSDTKRPPKLTRAELAASQALAQMLKDKVTTMQSLQNSNNARDNIASESEAAVDKEIADLVDRGKYNKSLLEDSNSDADDSPSATVRADVFRSRSEHIIRYKSPAQSRPVIQMDGNRRKSLKGRLPTPMANSPSPEPEGPLPSLYEKLYRSTLT